MIDIVDRLRFDATRCELQFSKGVAGNINEAADEIERLRRHAQGALLLEAAVEVVAAVRGTSDHTAWFESLAKLMRVVSAVTSTDGGAK